MIASTPSSADFAQTYLGLGWRVVPIPPGEKGPRLAGWPNLRLEADAIPAAFPHGKNVGILLGEPSAGLVDVDLDTPEAAALADTFLPPTHMRHGRPGKPGAHRWYHCDPPPARTAQHKAPDGTCLAELRSTGVATLVPPSRHPSGDDLAWEEDGEPARVDAAELGRAVARVAAGVLLARTWPAKGSRHEAALALAGMLERGGWTEEHTSAFVEEVARAAGDEEAAERAKNARTTAGRLAAEEKATGAPTLEKLVGEEVVERVRCWLGLKGAPAREPWEPPVPFHDFDLPPFPTDALPGWLRAWAEAEAEATQTPPDLPAMLGLACDATACAKKVEVEVRPGWSEPVNLFVVVALPPAERKSAVFSDATRPLAEHEREEAQRATPEFAAAASARRVAEAALKAAELAAAKARPDEAERLAADAAERARGLEGLRVPVPPRLRADDVTPERLATLLRDQGGRMAVLSPEGGVFDLMAGRYAEGGPNFEVYLKGHAGDDLRVDRVGRPSEHVRRPALTLGLAVQPAVIRGLAAKPGFRGRGLLARFLYALPRSRVGARIVGAPPVPPAVAEAYARGIRALLAVPVRRDPDGELEPALLCLSDAGRAVLDDFARKLEPKLGPDGELACVADWAGKLAGAVARLAGLLHLADAAGDSAHSVNCALETRALVSVSAETVERAVRIGGYLIPHALAAFAEMGANPAVEAAKCVLGWVERNGKATFTKREAFMGTRPRFKRVPDLDPALDLLAEHDFIRGRPAAERPGPGRKPSPVFDVNPHTHNSHNAQNSAAGGDSVHSMNSAQGGTEPEDDAEEGEL